MSYFKGTGNGYVGAVGIGEIIQHGINNAVIDSIDAWSDVTEIGEIPFHYGRSRYGREIVCKF